MRVSRSADVVLTLSEAEARLLASLADFPEWEAQSEHVREFLASLHSEIIAETGGYQTAEAGGFVPKVSFGESRSPSIPAA